MNQPTPPTQLNATDTQRLLAMCKAISHPMRFAMLRYMQANPSCYTKDLVANLPLSQATVSQHIKMLREAGWVATEAKCQMTTHWLDEENIAWFKQQVGDLL